VRVQISQQQGRLEEDQARDPDGSRSAQRGQQLPGRHGLNQKKEKGSQKDYAAEEEPQLRHAGLVNMRCLIR
jgi:hypothetical protein